MIIFHTNKGDIKIEMFREEAPETVSNFIAYCQDGFYTNTIFHRVIDGFMIQGGDLNQICNKKPPDLRLKMKQIMV